MEQRKQIKDFPKYEVSDLGNIYRLEHNTKLKQFVVNTSARVNLLNENGRGVYLVKNIVANEFLNYDKRKHSVINMDGNPKNNRVCNLKVVPIFEKDLKILKAKEENKNTQLDVFKDGVFQGSFTSVADVARLIGVHRPNVYKIINSDKPNSTGYIVKRVKIKK